MGRLLGWAMVGASPRAAARPSAAPIIEPAVRLGGFVAPFVAAASDDRIFLVSGTRLVVLDAHTPAIPRRTAKLWLPRAPLQLAAAAHEVYVVDGTDWPQRIDASDPSDPMRLVPIKLPAAASAVAAVEGRAFVGSATGRLSVIETQGQRAARVRSGVWTSGSLTRIAPAIRLPCSMPPPPSRGSCCWQPAHGSTSSASMTPPTCGKPAGRT
jgi:hypothetical protein